MSIFKYMYLKSIFMIYLVQIRSVPKSNQQNFYNINRCNFYNINRLEKLTLQIGYNKIIRINLNQRNHHKKFWNMNLYRFHQAACLLLVSTRIKKFDMILACEI